MHTPESILRVRVQRPSNTEDFRRSYQTTRQQAVELREVEKWFFFASTEVCILLHVLSDE